ncbi:MAG: 50S ribosomal protein L4 [Dehalococcoidia bacterium]|jgi:large subunit ribosomal protein L4
MVDCPASARRVFKVVQVPVHNSLGKVIDNIELSDEVFGIPMNSAVVHQAMLRQNANARQGTVGVKTRGQVSGGGKKPYKQKGTGRARRGSSRSPLMRGGGIVFGPQARSYRQGMPRKMRRLALRCVLSCKVSDGEIKIIDKLSFGEPNTKEIAGIVKALDLGPSLMIITDEPDGNVYKSARNLDGADVLPAYMLNVGALLTHRQVLVSLPAIRKIDEIWKPSAKEPVKV